MITDLNREQWKLRISEVEEIANRNILANKKEKIYCFLDFDGVINIWNKPLGGLEKSIKEAEFQMMDYECVKELSEFCQNKNIEVVISSTWRIKGLDYCRNFLQKGGFDPNIPIVGTTQLELDGDREILITDFLLEHPDYTNFIIVDDYNLFHLSSHMVLCDTQVGFDADLHGKAEQLLAHMHSDYMLMSQGEYILSAAH